jgi:SAM-dependent methyltransferase
VEPDPQLDPPPGPPVGPNPDDWNARYVTGELTWDLGQASPPLARFLEEGLLPEPGTVLVPGCGSGHELPLLARAGHRPIGVDFAPLAVEAARARLAASGLQGRVLRADVLDPEIDVAPASVDWVFDQTCYCALPPEHRADYARALARLVRPGGELWALNMRTPYADRAPFDSTPEEHVAVMERAGFELVLRRALDEESLGRRRGRETLLRLRRT